MVSDEKFAAVERRFGIKLPADYRDIVRKYQGAMPRPNGIDFPGGGTGVEYLYHYEKEPYLENIIVAYDDFRRALPNYVIPFAAGNSGDCFCFDFRGKSDNPTVVVWVYDDGLDEPIYLANSFTEWLDLLVP